MKNVLKKITSEILVCVMIILTVSGCGTDKANKRVQTVLMQQDGNILLYEDGTVWESDRETGALSRIAGLENILKIMDAGGATYALSETGEVYAWGENRGLMISTEASHNTVYDEPVKVSGLSDIVEMDVRKTPRNEHFRIDQCIDYLMGTFGFQGDRGQEYVFTRTMRYE